MDREDAIESRDREDLRDRDAGADDRHPTAGLAHALEPGDQDTQPARVHERHVGEIDDEETAAVIDDAFDPRAELGRGRQVDLTGDVEDVPSALGTTFDLDLDLRPPSSRRRGDNGTPLRALTI